MDSYVLTKNLTVLICEIKKAIFFVLKFIVDNLESGI